MRSLLLWLDVDATELAQAPLEQGGAGMTEMLDYFMLFLLLALAAYMFYTVWKLRRECMLFENKLLYPGNCSPEECLDPDGFQDFIAPRMLLCAVALVLCAALCALTIWVPAVQNPVTELLTLLLPMAVLVWYILIGRRAARDFWGK